MLCRSVDLLINLDKRTYAGNLENLASLLNEHKPRAVINFAAESHVGLPSTAPVNLSRPTSWYLPLAGICADAREVLTWGRLPNWMGLGSYTPVATAIAWAGYAWFKKPRKGYADVL